MCCGWGVEKMFWSADGELGDATVMVERTSAFPEVSSDWIRFC